MRINSNIEPKDGQDVTVKGVKAYYWAQKRAFYNEEDDKRVCCLDDISSYEITYFATPEQIFSVYGVTGIEIHGDMLDVFVNFINDEIGGYPMNDNEFVTLVAELLSGKQVDVKGRKDIIRNLNRYYLPNDDIYHVLMYMNKARLVFLEDYEIYTIMPIESDDSWKGLF